MSQTTASAKPISPLRRRMIEDMTVRGFAEKVQNDYIRHVKNFTIFLGRSPDTATPEDLRGFQLHQRDTGVQPPTMNGAVSALRFFLVTTCNQPDMARHLKIVEQPQKQLHGGLGDPKYAPCPLFRRYVAAGRLGRKSGRGFYEYG